MEYNNRERTSLWVIVGRVAFTAALIACIWFIFSNSMAVATVSSGSSGRVLEGFLLMLCMRVYSRHPLRHITVPMLGGVLTALTDETIQLFSEGRSSQVTDVWLDSAGVLAGILVAIVLLLACEGLYYHMKRRHE